MINIIRSFKDPDKMDIKIQGNAEEIAQEFAALTLKLKREFPMILDRATWYLDDLTE